MPLDGGFAALIAKSKTESWDDDVGITSHSIEYDFWIYRPEPSKSRQPASQAAPASAQGGTRPFHIKWSTEQGCTEAADSGGGETSKSLCSLLLVQDLDDDGQPEVVLKKYKSSSSAGCCSTFMESYTYEFYGIEGETLVPYEKFPSVIFEKDTFTTTDYDKDGRPDFFSHLDYKLPSRCYKGPGFLIHGLPGGEFSRDDAVAQKAARAWCPRPPSRTVKELRSDELAEYVLCSRLWGASAEQVKARLRERCIKTSSIEVDDAGAEHYSYPWQFCYRAGLECDSPEIHDFCGGWLEELADVEPPFRLQTGTPNK